MDNEYDIFISYSRRDLELVSTIKSEIEKVTNARCWMDLEGIEAGTPRFTKAIVDSIKNCRIFLFMCTEQSQNSKFALRELNYASNHREHVVIVRIDDRPLNDEFEFLYDLTDSIEWNNHPQRKKLFRDITRWTEKINEEPIVIEQKKEEGTEIHIETDANYNMYRYKTFIKLLNVNVDGVIHLKPGTHKLEFVSEEFPEVKVSMVYSLEGDIDSVFIPVSLKNQVEEEKAKRIADEARKNKLAGDNFYKRKKYADAVTWYHKAAEQGDAAAQYNLGVMYQNGEGVPKSYEEAVRWYHKAADQGYAVAQYNLGVMFHYGLGVPQNYDEAVRWYRKSAEQGNADAQFNLGNMYENGKGMSQSNDEAAKWYHKAAEQGDAAALNNLGEMYYYGKGVPQNYEEAVKWFRKSADQGNADAQFNLGWMYYYGEGVPQSNDEAVRWYRKAAELGDVLAKNALKELTGQ